MSRALACLLVLVFSAAVVVRAQESAKVESAAKFVKVDDKTAGNWKGVYGADGAVLNADGNNPPAYAKFAAPGSQDFTWADTTDDTRALRKAAKDAADRLAACWYSSDPWDIDINLTDGKEHQVAIYCLDWDSAERAMTVEVQNADTGTKLDSHEMKEYHDGKYMVWNLKGHVKLHFTNTAGVNAAVSGVFFDSVAKAK